MYSQAPPHKLNPKEQAFIKQLNPQEKALHDLATKMLGTSYFVGKTHAYNKWISTQPNPDKPLPATK